MKARRIGEFEVSEIGLGCMSLSHAYGAPPPRDQAERVLKGALDAGYTFLDTAALYGLGHNETLIGEVLGVYDVPISFNMEKGKGTIVVGDAINAEMEPYTDMQGRPTKMVDTIFSTVPGSPAYVGHAENFRTNIPQHGMTWQFNGRNAVLAEFRFEG